MVDQIVVDQGTGRGIRVGESLEDSRKERESRVGRIGILHLHWRINVGGVPTSGIAYIHVDMEYVRGRHTATTLRRPSKTSRSCLLSNNFLMCAAGSALAVLRGPASRAASRVRSRAVAVSGEVSLLVMVAVVVEDDDEVEAEVVVVVVLASSQRMFSMWERVWVRVWVWEREGVRQWVMRVREGHR